jgi:hypothetical protein
MVKAKADKKQMGSFGELLGTPRWRKTRSSVCCSRSRRGWAVGIGFFSFDLFRPVLTTAFEAEGLTGAALRGKVTTWIGVTSLFQNLGAFFGIYAFTYITSWLGRRKAFAVSFLAAMAMTAYTFWNLKQLTDIFWMVPLMDSASSRCSAVTPSTSPSCSPRASAAPAPASATTSAASSPPPDRSRSASSPAASTRVRMLSATPA